MSSGSDVTVGFPQGSRLGPDIFNIYMNDMFYCIEKCQLYNYADDNKLSSVAKEMAEVISNLKDDAINFMSNVSIRCKTIKCFAEIVLPF
jgi:hypothetical protein